MENWCDFWVKQKKFACDDIKCIEPPNFKSLLMPPLIQYQILQEVRTGIMKHECSNIDLKIIVPQKRQYHSQFVRSLIVST